MDEDAKTVISCGSISCIGLLAAFAAVVFIIAAAIKWVAS